MEVEDLTKKLNEHLEQRMFLVGHSITAADVFTLAHLLDHFVFRIILLKSYRLRYQT